MRIVVRLRRSEGDLERLVGLFRRRAWQITTLEARASRDGATMTVHATLEGDRSPEVLARQVERLIEVEAVHLDESELQVPRLAPVRAKEV
ncbi:MAG: ACT domain-containing protein [Polyangiales bacterium]